MLQEDYHQKVSEPEEMQSNCSDGSNSRVDQSSLTTRISNELESHDVSEERSRNDSKSGNKDDSYSREKLNNSSANNQNYSTESYSQNEPDESGYSEVESRSDAKQRYYSGTDSKCITQERSQNSGRSLESKMRSPRQSISETNGDAPQSYHHESRNQHRSERTESYSNPGLSEELPDPKLWSIGNNNASSSRHQNLDIVNPSPASPRLFDLKLNRFLNDTEEDVNALDFMNQV